MRRTLLLFVATQALLALTVLLAACHRRTIGDGHIVRCEGDRGAFVIQRDTLFFLGDTTEDGVWQCVMGGDDR